MTEKVSEVKHVLQFFTGSDLSERMCKYLKFREYFILTNQNFSKLLSFPKTKETVRAFHRSDLGEV